MTATGSTTPEGDLETAAPLLPEAAAATGIGSLPGTNAREATAVVFGETDLPYVPELPARGPGADMVGRTMSLLAQVDPAFSVTTTPSGWRLADRPGRDVRRALSWWGEDLDAVQEVAGDYVGPIKVALAGPLTMAAAVELVSGEKVLRDQGARRDIAAALAVAAQHLVADLQRRVPGARVVVQLDEPSAPAVLAGEVRSASGLTKLLPIEPVEVESLLRGIVESLHAHDVRVALHSCAATNPFDLWQRVGFDALSLDATLFTARDFDALGGCVDRGTALVLGVVPTTRQPSAEVALRRVTDLQRELSFDDATWLPAIAVSPTCGLATLSPEQARDTIDVVKSVARSLRGATDDVSHLSA